MRGKLGIAATQLPILMLCSIMPLAYGAERVIVQDRAATSAVITPLSASVFTTIPSQIYEDSRVKKYLLKQQYLDDVNRSMLGTTNRLLPSPVRALDEERQQITDPQYYENEVRYRQDFAQTAAKRIIRSGGPEYAVQIFGLFKLREDMRKFERAVSFTVPISSAAPKMEPGEPIVESRQRRTWRFQSDYYASSLSYKVAFTNDIITADTEARYSRTISDAWILRVGSQLERFYAGAAYLPISTLASIEASYRIAVGLNFGVYLGTYIRAYSDDERGTTSSGGFTYVF